MSIQVLTDKEARIISAIGSGLVPTGGQNFKIGAAELADKWVPRTDYLLSRMPFLTRYGLKFFIHLLNRVWPLLYLRRLRTLEKMNEKERTRLFHAIENSKFPGHLTILVAKVLVFPAFYGLPEVKQAIGYQERFPVHPDFEGLKK